MDKMRMAESKDSTLSEGILSARVPTAKELSDAQLLAHHFRTEVKETACKAVAQFNANYRVWLSVQRKHPPLSIKYVLRYLRRAAESPRIAAKLFAKLKDEKRKQLGDKKRNTRFDDDTIELLGAGEFPPTREAILERILVLEHYRKLREGEPVRYHCGCLRALYERCGAHPGDLTRRRAFVAEALSNANIRFPDPAKHPKRLEEWISTPTHLDGPIDPALHSRAAQQAAGLSKKHRP